MADSRITNYTLKEDIRDFWSVQATRFDSSPFHRIDDKHGMPEWRRFIRDACDLAPDASLTGRKVLDIACGTGEISRMLCGLGASVTGIDFSEAMLAQARQKLQGADWKGFLCDAESLALFRDREFDLIVTRHLVWTLTAPEAAFREWRRVLKPGGRLIVVDGDWVSRGSLAERLTCWFADRLTRSDAENHALRERHQTILPQVAYAQGLAADRLEADLRTTGFTAFRRLPLDRVYGPGMRHASLPARLRVGTRRRFALAAE